VGAQPVLAIRQEPFLAHLEDRDRRQGDAFVQGLFVDGDQHRVVFAAELPYAVDGIDAVDRDGLRRGHRLPFVSTSRMNFDLMPGLPAIAWIQIVVASWWHVALRINRLRKDKRITNPLVTPPAASTPKMGG